MVETQDRSDKMEPSNMNEESSPAAASTAKEPTAVDTVMESVDKTDDNAATDLAQSKNTISTSTTGEDDSRKEPSNDITATETGYDAGRNNHSGRGGRGGNSRRGGYGRGGGRGGNYRGRNQRRHAPYRNTNNNQNGEDVPDEERGLRVYVGNLSWDVAWTDLKDHMKTTGCEVTRADVMTNHDGRSKGCGIVEFATPDGARRAVLTLNDTELMGRQIFVREDREGRGGGQSQGGNESRGGGGGEQLAAPRGRRAHTNNNSNTNAKEPHVAKMRVTTEESEDSEGDEDDEEQGNAQSRRCYVGNLSWDVAWQDLKDHMRSEGDVVFVEVMSEADGRSKGCGIVEFATPEEAQNAIANLTDTDLKGRTIFVREDRETSNSGTGGGHTTNGGGNSGGFGGNGNSRQTASVYVGNLSFETSWQDLKDHMRGAGNVDQANVLQSDDGRSKGCGIVLFQRPQDAQRAIRELHNSELHGRSILVREDREQGGGGGGGFRNQHRGGHRGGGGRNDTNTSGGNDGGGGARGTQLFVGNLSFDTTWREVKDHFRQCGDVERAEVMEGPDGRKKGFGTVKFFKQKDANNAIRRLNDTELQGRQLEVRLDHKAN